MSNMEGMLWKWTNYFSGWQPRWFVLEQGILSYYRSQDDVINGCKGSIKMSVCDVLVHPNDATRLDLIIPGEAHFYVKAATAQERQQWLVALGSSKACLSNNCLPLPSSPTAANAALDELPEMPLKAKKSELRLYCDLLMQQVHSVKCAVQDKDTPDIERLNESTSLLSATCDTFISTLEECLRLAHANIDATFATGQAEYVLMNSSGGLSPTHSNATPRSLKSKAIPWPVNSIQRSTSADSYQKRLYSQTQCSFGNGKVSRYLPSTRYLGGLQKKGMSRTTSESSETDTSPPTSALASGPHPLHHKEVPGTYVEHNGRSDIDQDLDDHEPMIKDSSPPLPDIRLQTFFSKIDASFIDIRLTSDLEIPTVPFLDACRSILPIFDKLHQTAFAPARLDIASNIKRIHQKYLISPEVYVSLQKMIISEMHSRQSHLATSATSAILWLNRALEFIHEVIQGFLFPLDDMVAVVNAAYTKTLSDYHGWVLRGAFAMAVRAVPSRTEFIRCFSLDESHVNHPSFLTSLMHDMEDHDMALTTVTRLLHDFLRQNNLDSPEQV